jgi:hypothetical protein
LTINDIDNVEYLFYLYDDQGPEWDYGGPEGAGGGVLIPCAEMPKTMTTAAAPVAAPAVAVPPPVTAVPVVTAVAVAAPPATAPTNQKNKKKKSDKQDMSGKSAK